MTTDDPYAEGEEHIGGFWVIEAPNLDDPQEWARRAAIACEQAVEF